MTLDFNRLKDRISQWWRYPQPTWEQRKLLGLYTDSIDIDFTARRLASESSAEYLTNFARRARNFATDYDLHEWMPSQIDPRLADGLYLEFGVATGRTLNHWGRLWPEHTIYGFDGFEGLPETWTWYLRKGAFQQSLPSVRRNCELVVGWFDKTLEPFLVDHAGDAAFVHIDCDLYSSTAYVLTQLQPRIRPGTVILFDEYWNFPGWQDDEFNAWQEFVLNNDVKYSYLGFVSQHQQVAVRVDQIG
jgi:Methyltransferase domain